MTLVPRESRAIFDPNAGSTVFEQPKVEAPSADDLIAAAFRQENIVGSLVAKQWYTDDVEPGFNAWDQIKGTKYEPYFDDFGDVLNTGAADAKKRQIDMEMSDRNTLAAGGGWGVLASIGAGVFSPENLLPGGAAYKGVKLGSAIVRTAMATASAAAISAAAAETVLGATQTQRTAEESLFNIGGSFVLGGMLGGGASALFSRGDFARLGKALDTEAVDAVNSPALAENERLMLQPSSAGAAARPVATLDENTIAGTAAQVAGGVVRGMNPVLRVLHSASPVTREIGTRLFENPVYLKKNMAGVASDPAVETLTKEFTQGAMARAIDDANGIYRDYRRSGGALKREEFNVAVGRAMRRADEGDDPAVSRAAATWRKAVFDPLKDLAIQSGLLPKDVSVDTAASYLTRVYNRPMIEAKEAQFKGIVRQYIDQQIKALEFKSDEIKIGNKIVASDRLTDKWRGAWERLSGMDDRLAGRAAVRRRKLDDLRSLQGQRFDAMKDRPPAELWKRLRNADENASMVGTLKELRAAERSAGKSQKYVEKYPILFRLKRRGGVAVGSFLDHELRNMGVNPQSHPGLFKKDGGLGAIDNWPWDEDEFFQQHFGNMPDGYVDQNQLLDAIRREVGGDPLRTPEQIAEEANLDALDSWASKWLDDVGLPPDSSVGDARAFIKRIAGAEKHYDELGSRITRLERDLDEFDDVTEGVANERIISEAEAAAVSRDLAKLEEEILDVRDIANASPRVKLIVDYATVRRDLFKKKLDEQRLRRRVDVLKSIRDEEGAAPPPSAIKNNQPTSTTGHPIPGETFDIGGTVYHVHSADMPTGQMPANTNPVVFGRVAIYAAGKWVDGRPLDGGNRLLGTDGKMYKTRWDGMVELQPGDPLPTKPPPWAPAAPTASRALAPATTGGKHSGRFNDAMAAELGAKSADLTRVLDSIDKLKAKADKLEPMVPKMHQELPEFVNDADRADYVDGVVNDIYNTLTGRNADGDIPRDIVAATRGPLKERTFNIPDAMIEEFLESNVEAVARRYARTMSSDIELTRAFGKADMKEQISQIKVDYQRLREATRNNVDPETGAPLAKPLGAAEIEKRTKALVAAEKNDIRDVQALRDMLRGAYLAKENSTSYARVARVAGTINYLRTMGGVTLSSLADVARHVMVHGLTGVMRDGLVPLISNLKGFKMSVGEAKIAGAVTDRLLNTRMATWADINDPYSVSSPFERFMDNTANGFSRLNGMNIWNDFQKSFASVITQNRVLRGVGDYARLGNREQSYLAYLGIDGAMAERITKQFALHGSMEDGGIRVAGTDDWDDDWARRVYRAAVNKDVDSTIITKGVGDVPLFMNTPTGRLAMQFKSFAIASHQRALMRGLQERPMGFVAGTMFATGAGMLIYFLKAAESNKFEDLSDNPGRWIAEGLDRSGLFSIAFEANNTLEKALGIGAYGALAAAFPDASQEGKASKYASRSLVSSFTGPTGDLIDTAVRAANVIKGDGKPWSEGDLNSIKKLIPGATLPGIRSLVEYFGMPAVRGGLAID